jgi:hypothetical protein
MIFLFGLTYGVLCGLILLEGLVLREVFAETLWFKRFYFDLKDGVEWTRPEPGTHIPDFSVPDLGRGRMFHASDFEAEGKDSILFFLSPNDGSSQLNQDLETVLHALWHRVEGHLYLICSASSSACRQLLDGKFPLDHVLLDEAGYLSRIFGIGFTPQAVELDGNARVLRYGRPEELHKSNQTAANMRPVWPDDRLMSGAAFARMDTKVSCVMTRFRLNSPFALIPFYLAFRRVRRESRKVNGLLKAVFLVENPLTCYTLSLWKDDWAIVEFGNGAAHVDAARSAFAAAHRKDHRAEIWSAQFRLWAVSCHNLNWDGLELRPLLADQWARREQVAKMGTSVGGERLA